MDMFSRTCTCGYFLVAANFTSDAAARSEAEFEAHDCDAADDDAPTPECDEHDPVVLSRSRDGVEVECRDCGAYEFVPAPHIDHDRF